MNLPPLDDEFLPGKLPGAPKDLYDVALQLPDGRILNLSRFKGRSKVRIIKIKSCRPNIKKLLEKINNTLHTEISSLVEVRESDIKALLKKEVTEIKICPKRN